MISFKKLLFPDRCIICDDVFEQQFTKEQKSCICEKCEPKIIRIKEPICKKCGRPIKEDDEMLCENCTVNAGRFHFEYARSVFANEGEFTNCIYRFKYSNKRTYAKTFAREALKVNPVFFKRNDFDVIIPVPLHKDRLKSRGYNQALLFAKEISKLTGIPVDDKSLKRQKKTGFLKEMTYRERQYSLKNAFKIGKNGVLSKKVLLVDDIFTTGATADRASEVILEAGADSVHVLCICAGV
ncbi:MAG: ComF family protein [Lachnospiraceae bacterium]|nr:ComF family protein [Lachnospiraceae bacterium]